MAHYSVHVSTVRRSVGQNAVATAAYISRSKLTLYATDKETNITAPLTWDYSKKGGLVFSKIYAPENAPDWVLDRQQLWNKAEQAENRCDAETANKIMVALPIEFSHEQNVEVAEKIASNFVSDGMVAEVAIHNDSDGNPHVHVQTTQRELVENRYGEIEFSRLKNRDWKGPQWIKSIREMVAEEINTLYIKNGFDLQVTNKSYKELGIDLVPSRHEGPAKNIKNSELTELNRQIGAENAERIKAKPSIILDVLGVNRPVFTKEQIATELEKRLHAGIDFSKIDNIESLQSELSATFNILYEKILVCPEISQVVEADLKGRTLYTTTKRLELEERFVANVEELHSRNGHALNIKDSDLDHLSWSEKIGAKLRDVKTDLIENINDKTGLKLEKPRQAISLSAEQRRAVVNILNGSDISVLEGIPGAGKTTVMREMVRQYQKAGFKVIGVAPSSAASLELAKATGIECKNASLWRKEWLQEQGKKFELVLRGDYYKEDLYKDNGSSLTKKHVMIIDEASMGELSNMDYLISEARTVGAKILKVGDSNQLSPVGWAGALDKTISICGSETLSESRRQQKTSHQEATKLLSQYRVRDALDIYWKEGVIKVAENESEANSMAVRSFVSSYIETARLIEQDDLISTRSKAIGVLENKTRNLLNSQVREQLKEAGILKGQEHRVLVGSLIKDGKYEKQYLSLSRGEQIVFSRNANRLGKGGVFNGELGTILKIHEADKGGLAKIDILAHKASGKKEKLSLDLSELANNKFTGRYFHDGISIDYGYAITSHKVEGASIIGFCMRLEKNTGFEEFNVLSTRHKLNLEIITDKETLRDAFYESLDETASKAKNRFELKLDNEETILKGGLAKMISKRSNTSFAGDYRTMGQTEEDKYIKQYIDKSEETIATVRKITSWQNTELRKTGVKPQMWEHKDWKEFKEIREGRSLAASTIIAGFAPNDKLSGDAREEYSHLTSAEFRKECVTASYAKFKDRIVQLGMNYATIEKHASQLKSKAGELDKVIVDQKATILHEQDIFKELVQSVSSGQTVSIRNSCALVNVHIAETNIAIEEKNAGINDIESNRQELTDALETEKHYRKILTPEYLSRIYRADKGLQENANTGIMALKKYEALISEHGADKATEMVVKEPGLLGNLKGYGIGKLFGINNDRKDAIALCENLGKQLNAYNRSGAMMEQYKASMEKADFGSRLFELSQEIEHLRSLLPADIDNEFLHEVEGKLQKTKSNNIDWRDLQKSELFETVRVGQYAQKENNIVTHEDSLVLDVDNKAISTKLQTAAIKDIELSNIKTAINKKEVHNTNANNETLIAQGILPSNEFKQLLEQKDDLVVKPKQQSQQHSKPIKPRLTFAQVKAGLNQSVVSEIFHRYGPRINPDDKVEKQGSQLKIGSLYMSVSGNKAGLWNRFSDGSKGDIFSFVEEASGCSKYESLEIIASHAGIVAQEDVTTKHATKTRLVSAATQGVGDRQNPTTKEAWIASEIVPKSAAKFNAEKDLAFLTKQGNIISLVYEYKNQDNQLLGYAVRIEDIETNKKQVLPVAYCHNKAEKASRWQLKGFTDAGTKPIYGLEKIKQHPNKPILIVEGEKTADAVAKLLPDHNVISWMGGAQAVDKVDWSKLANRIVAIWPDNDKPGMAAANNIANHIDCHNGFNGLATIIDTEKLELPKKWDLADELPKDSIIDKSNLSSIIDNASYNTAKAGKKLELSQAISNKFGNNKNEVLDSIDMLIATNRICKDEYISKEIYHDSLIAIAHLKGMDLAQIKDHKDFVTSISSVQAEYQSLHRNYEQDILRQQGINANSANTSKGKAELSTKEQLAHDLIRDTSILHQVQLEQNKLTATHTQHIEKTVHSEIEKMQRFTDSDKEHAASNVYKTISSKNWRDKLDVTNLAKTSDISLKFTAKSIDEFLVGARSSTQIQSAHGDLENIRKYGLDENAILTTFKEGRTAGIDALKEMSNKLTIASGLAAEHSLVIAEAQQWGYKANDTDIVKALVGMDAKQSKNYCTEIRDNYLSEHLDSNLNKFKVAKQHSYIDMNKLKSLMSQEQEFLKTVYKSISFPIQEYSYECKPNLEEAKTAYKNPEFLEKSFKMIDKLESEFKFDSKMISFEIGHLSDSEYTLSSLVKCYEFNRCYTAPELNTEQRLDAKSLNSLFTAIENEQSHLASLHGNIQHYDHDKLLLSRVEKAYKESKSDNLSNLKEISYRSVSSGAITEGYLVSKLKLLPDFQATYKDIDKHIEGHDMNITLARFEENKIQAKTTSDIVKIIGMEQEYLSSLHGNIKYPEYNNDASEKAKLARSQKDSGCLVKLKEITQQSLSIGAKTEKELLAELSLITDLKYAHKKLDKDIEAYTITKEISKFREERNSQKTLSGIIGAMQK
jgi:nucleoside-triphosphatase THEP1